MPGFNRATLSTILLVALAVVAIGLVAATIDTVVATGPGVGEGDQDPDDELIQGGDRIEDDFQVRGSEGGEGRNTAIDLRYCIEFLTTLPAVLGILAATSLIFFAVYRRYNVAATGLFATGYIPFVMLFYFVLTNCPASMGGGGGFAPSGDQFLQDGGPLIGAPPVPASVIVGLLAVVTVAAVVLMVTMTGTDETLEPISEEESTDPETSDFARAAGRAADLIEEKNVAIDNAVYRAWMEMTSLLDIENPETTAPRDFAQEAMAVGMSSDDVSELTELFNEVRYGGKDAENREQRALEILRNIERTYQDTTEETGDEQ